MNRIPLSKKKLLEYLKQGKPLGKYGIQDVSFRGENLSGYDFSYLRAHRVDFKKCNLRRCRFIGAKLRDCDFRFSDISLSSFRFANLRGSNLKRVMAQGTDWGYADIRNTDWCDLTITYDNRLWKSTRVSRKTIDLFLKTIIIED